MGSWLCSTQPVLGSVQSLLTGLAYKPSLAQDRTMDTYVTESINEVLDRVELELPPHSLRQSGETPVFTTASLRWDRNVQFKCRLLPSGPALLRYSLCLVQEQKELRGRQGLILSMLGMIFSDSIWATVCARAACLWNLNFQAVCLFADWIPLRMERRLFMKAAVTCLHR